MQSWLNSFVYTLQASKYKLKIDNGKKQYDETIEIDPEKQTEKFHIPSTDSGPSSPGDVDTIHDFDKV